MLYWDSFDDVQIEEFEQWALEHGWFEEISAELQEQRHQEFIETVAQIEMKRGF